MTVVVKLFATLRNFGPDVRQMELPENSTVEDAIRMLHLPSGIPLLKIVNGEHRDIHYSLKDGDEVALFPPIAGGSRIRIVHNPWGKRRGMVPGADLRMRLRMLICFGIAILSANFG